ncbi:MAG: hypothetical protein ACLUKQ_08530 [Peptococcaceae bacterium]
MSKQIIYTKYSSNRSEKFKISTQILKDTTGNKIVRKIAMTKLAKNHVEQIAHNYCILRQRYETDFIHINKCILRDEAVEFEYVVGTSLEEILDRYLKNNELDKFMVEVQHYYDYLKRLSVSDFFKPTEEFVHVFGQYDEQKTEIIRLPVNIDLIFSNIIVGANNWTIIDYEWVFPFAIPLNYVLYRAMNTYITGDYRLRNFVREALMEIFCLSEDELLQYIAMEKHFQTFVGDREEICLKQNLQRQRYDFQRILAKNYTQEFQIFFDYGEGFSEENSYKLYQDFSEKYELEILIPKAVKKFRIDPGSQSCIIQINELSCMMSNSKKYLDYETNGLKVSPVQIVYWHNDPQILVSFGELDKIVSLNLSITLGKLSNVFLANFIGIFNELQSQKDENFDLKQINSEINMQNEKLNLINDSLHKEINVLREEIGNYSTENDCIKKEKEKLENELNQIKNSLLGKMFFR